MLAETVILRPVPGDREPAVALRNVTADIGLPSGEIHAYFITTVYDCAARISISWIFYEVVFPSAAMIKSRRDQLFTPGRLYSSTLRTEIRLDAAQLNARLIAYAVLRNLNGISIIIRVPFPFAGADVIERIRITSSRD